MLTQLIPDSRVSLPDLVDAWLSDHMETVTAHVLASKAFKTWKGKLTLSIERMVREALTHEDQEATKRAPVAHRARTKHRRQR